MKCPKCKKSSELQTKRTIANGSKVTRERYCPRCKSRFITIEQFRIDIDKAKDNHAKEVLGLMQVNDELSDSLENYQDFFKGLKRIIDEAGEK